MAYVTIAELRAYLDLQDSTTFTADAAADTLALASISFRNTLQTGTEVLLTNSELVADLPAPLAENTTYYVILGADQLIQLATTSALAGAGTQINITDAGTGTHTITRANADTDLLQDAIDNAAAYIDGQTGKHFEAETATRYYQRDALDWKDRHLLVLDNWLLTVTALKNGDASETAIANTEYWLWPRNETPYWGIRLKTNSATDWEFDTDYWVSVAGTWGYSATCPADIKEATMHLAAFFYRRKDSQIFDTTAVPEAGVITIPQGIPVGVERIIKRYQQNIGW